MTAGAASLPLRLEVEIVPAEARVGTPSTLLGRLANESGKPQLVNTRLLLNHPGQSGEVSIEVTGPPGWTNAVQFRIRAGVAGVEFFRELADGEWVDQSWDLDQYLDLDAPGDYVITVSYRQERRTTPDGRPLATGVCVATATARRFAG
ncbi:MAG: hypothetical protein ACJ74U_18075 [Jatrophihabitantaceae bacterium]